MSSHSAGTSAGAVPLSVRVLLAGDDADQRAALSRELVGLGHTVVREAATARETVEAAREHTPDVVVLELKDGDPSWLEAAHLIAREQPDVAAILLSRDSMPSPTDADLAPTMATALLCWPVATRAVECTVRLAMLRARELKAARDEVSSLRTQLENRKAIERAKGILMRRTGLSEQEAYRILQRTSQDRSVPMAVVAKEVLESEPSR